LAKSGRSKCKKCKTPIGKDTLRILVEVEPNTKNDDMDQLLLHRPPSSSSSSSRGEYTISSSYHLACFALPKVYQQQELSVAYFVEHVLHEKLSASTHGSRSHHQSSSTSTSTSNQKKKKDSVTTIVMTTSIFPSRTEEIIQAIELASSSSSSKRKQSLLSSSSPITVWKQAYLDRCHPNKNNSTTVAAVGRPHKVMKLSQDTWSGEMVGSSSSSSSFGRTSTTTTNVTDPVELYGIYCSYTNEELKDMLRYNRQIMTGNKDLLLYKVMDGCRTNGRLTYCPLCTTGKLKIIWRTTTTNNNTTAMHSSPPVVVVEEEAMVQCSGTFDEISNRRMDCSYICPPDQVPPSSRHGPFYTLPPSDTERERMDQYEQQHLDGSGSSGNNTNQNSTNHADDDGRPTTTSTTIMEWYLNTIQQSSTFHWDVSTREGIRNTTQELVQILLVPPSSPPQEGIKTIDLPTTFSEAVQKVGPILATHSKNSSSSSSTTPTSLIRDILTVIVQQFGFREDKVHQQQQKENVLSSIVQHPHNVALVMAFQELSQLYYQTGNANAGTTYRKVVASLQSITYPITKDNAKLLCKGTTKVLNIGKSTADKIYEFVTTGTMEKLIEKRADANV
jgi:hypothetical protein